MKFYKQIIFILIVFFKTETLFSENNLFNVNNIKIEKKDKISKDILTNQAIKKGFNQLISRILLKDDEKKLLDLSIPEIKQLVSYYQITNIFEEKSKKELLKFSITFDKSKMHDLFYKKRISYSEVLDKELYILPVLIRANKIYIFNNNYFYENWNKIYIDGSFDFILPLENIEIIQNINNNKNNLIDLKLANLFEEYKNKNLALILIENNKINNEKVYIKSLIHGKNISRSLTLKRNSLKTEKFFEKVIIETKKELVNLVKSRNLIDISAPSFLNAQLHLDKTGNLVKLNSRIKNIDSIENIYVQEFNKDYMSLRIKYLGKLEKIINQLKIENIDLQLINEQWIIKTL